jgi:hypothetical protein
VNPPFDPFERLPRALHPLAHAPAGPGWNHAELADLLPASDALRPAAVLVALIDRAQGASVLLTRRTEALRHHGGQISFPGGRIDPGDADPVAAALREADEEVGLARGQSSPLGYLDPFVTITRACRRQRWPRRSRCRWNSCSTRATSTSLKWTGRGVAAACWSTVTRDIASGAPPPPCW